MTIKKRFRELDTVKKITIGFILLILLGACLLALPFTTRAGNETTFLDALFIATSAVCVTGLATVSVADQFNTLGQFIIMCLIEIGGLGFMSVGVMLAIALRKKLSFKSRMVLRDSLNVDSFSGLVSLMLFVLKSSLVIQLLGALLFSFKWIPEYGWLKGSFYSVFHSVSAFCNAGFDLFGDSLMSFQESPYILVVFSFLIISGGLGFLVWSDILSFSKRRKLTIHTKLSLIITGALLIFGTVFFYLTDISNGALAFNTGSKFNQFINYTFLSVTPRTAGFATIDYGTLSYAGLFVTIFLMFIGGTSGSTAGGIKTTTFGVLILVVRSILRGRKDVEFQERRISEQVVRKAFVIFFIGISLIAVTSFILLLTETIPVDKGMDYIIFEVVSALATVGLSGGLTAELTTIGKIVMIILMFIGRVGIYTVLFTLVRKEDKNTTGKVKYPQESILIG